ncbi:MAG: hypothetical protein EOO15_07160 [Chitinophagaceae bacterium]|nr:MAG: hypothetical protein EOO15_07160 [Chitinophagaceae bacterium]
MRKALLSLFCLFVCSMASAQKGGRMYRNAIGGRAEFGFGSWVGVSWKHLYTRHHATELNLMFGGLTTVLDAEYHFNGNFRGIQNLQWVLGAGAAVALYKYYDRPNDFFFRPVVGLDARLKGTPINIGVDWRPLVTVNGGSNSTYTRFGVPIRLAF